MSVSGLTFCFIGFPFCFVVPGLLNVLVLMDCPPDFFSRRVFRVQKYFPIISNEELNGELKPFKINGKYRLKLFKIKQLSRILRFNFSLGLLALFCLFLRY